MRVGIDVSKEMLDVGFRPAGERLRFVNDPDGIGKLIEALRSYQVELVALEASGGFERECAAALMLAKIPTAIVNPRQVRDFAKATGKLAKTDGIDCEVIAHFAEAIRPPESTLDDEDTKKLKALVDRRAQLIEMRTMENNRKQLATEDVKRELNEHIEWLNKRIKDVDKDISKRIRESKVWHERAKLLETATGIARTTSARLLVDLPELGKVSNKKIAALVGVAPYNDESGKYDGKRRCRGGRADLRAALYMPTLSAIKHDPTLAAYYARLMKAGKSHKTALIACMRKLLVMLNAMVRHHAEWNPS